MIWTVYADHPQTLRILHSELLQPWWSLQRVEALGGGVPPVAQRSGFVELLVDFVTEISHNLLLRAPVDRERDASVHGIQMQRLCRDSRCVRLL
ncbi:MAG TPA: hypothetical protein VGL91_14155 [Acidobacteriota bacterium]